MQKYLHAQDLRVHLVAFKRAVQCFHVYLMKVPIAKLVQSCAAWMMLTVWGKQALCYAGRHC